MGWLDWDRAAAFVLKGAVTARWHLHQTSEGRVGLMSQFGVGSYMTVFLAHMVFIVCINDV